MDPKLRAELIAKIDLARGELEGRKTSLQGDEKRPFRGTKNVPSRPGKTKARRLTDPLYRSVRRKLLKARVWKAIQLSLSQRCLRRVCKPTGAFPCYLPAGRRSLRFAESTVLQFLAYKSRYEARAQTRTQQDDKRLEELRRLAAAIEPYAQTDPTLTVAQAFDRARGPRVVSMPG